MDNEPEEKVEIDEVEVAEDTAPAAEKELEDFTNPVITETEAEETPQ